MPNLFNIAFLSLPDRLGMRLAPALRYERRQMNFGAAGFIARRSDGNFKTRWSMKARVETTLGDLIVALTEETDRQVRDEKMAYEIVAYILADLMKGRRQVLRQP
jgi:hypothetical protein